MKALVLLLVVSARVAPAFAGKHRSSAARAEFKRLHPCPANGQARGACPGWVVDHVVPLCADGPDAPANMQWQTVADAKAKDRAERRQCANLSRR